MQPAVMGFGPFGLFYLLYAEETFFLYKSLCRGYLLLTSSHLIKFLENWRSYGGSVR